MLPPLCPGCGLAVPEIADRSGPAGGRCGACILRPLGFDGARAAVEYAGTGRRLLLKAKFGGRHELFEAMGIRLSRCLEAAGFDLRRAVVVPVPSDLLTHARRGFNPAASLARPIARTLGLPFRPGYLRRRIVRPSRTARDAAGMRHLELCDAFRASARLPRGASLILVDDVLTTGATARACLNSLKAAGAGRVVLAVWARTSREMKPHG